MTTGQVEILGQAALRLLPATLALLLLVAWFTTRVEPQPIAPATPAPTENVLNWLVDQEPAQ